MSDGAPISQEIRLPTNSDEIGKATAKLDALIAKVSKLEHAGEGHHKQTKETEGAFRQLAGTMGKVIRGTILLGEGFRGAGLAAREAHAGFGEFLEFAGAMALLEVLNKVAEKVIEIGKEMIVGAAEAERMNFAIDAAAGGKEKGENVRKWVEANAKYSEFSEAKNEGSYLGLKRFGVSDQRAGLFMKGAEDLAALAAPDKREAVYDEALAGFGRMHARGKVDARSAMRGFGFGVEDFAGLDQFKGKGIKEIGKAIQSGGANVSENDILNMIVKRTNEKALGERSADASGLLMTKMAKLSELPTLFYKRLADTTAIKKLTGELDGVLKKLDPDSPAGKKIFGGLESVFTTIADVVGEIDFGELADSLVSDVVPAIKQIASLIKPTLEFLEREIHGFEVLHDMLLGETPQNKSVSGFKSNFKRGEEDPDAPSFLKPLSEQPTRPNNRRNAEDEGLSSLNAGTFVGKAIDEGLANGIDESQDAEQAVSDKADRLHRITKKKHKINSPSAVFEEFGAQIGEGLALGIEGSDDRVSKAVDSTMRISADGYTGATSVAGLGGGVQVTIGDIIVSGGGNPTETAQALREEVRRSILPELIDAIERARTSRGL